MQKCGRLELASSMDSVEAINRDWSVRRGGTAMCASSRRTWPWQGAIRCVVVTLVALSLLDRAECSTGWAGCHVHRPPPEDRLFESKAVDAFLRDTLPRFKDERIARVVNVTLPNALDTTFLEVDGREDTFVITGDIKAMWLRDATFQVLPYLRFVKSDTPLRDAICGLLKRQARSIKIDRYANAFNFNASGAGHQNDFRVPKMQKSVFEGKYELDSLVSFLKLSNEYSRSSVLGDSSTCFTESVHWLDALSLTFRTLREQQRSTAEDQPPSYKFVRSEMDLSYNGTGAARKRTGLVSSGFRPSDDACALPFHVASNLWLRTELLRLVNETLPRLRRWVEEDEGKDKGGIGNGRLWNQLAALGGEAEVIAREVGEGIERHARAPSPVDETEVVFAYEVDGYGSHVLMDDANAPSLLSLRYLGALSTRRDEEIFENTKRVVLSGASNPFYFAGKAAQGVGSPHVGYRFIWPLGLIYEAWATEDEGKLVEILETLVSATAGTNCMHESFSKDDSAIYTRPWFAWANSAFGELILHLVETKPWLLLKSSSV